MRYKLFFVSDSGRYVGSFDIDRDSDAKAIEVAGGISSDLAMVLWQRDRLVRAFPKIDKQTE